MDLLEGTPTCLHNWVDGECATCGRPEPEPVR